MLIMRINLISLNNANKQMKRRSLIIMEKSRSLEFYEKMVLIRKFELAAARLFAANRLPGFLHLYAGQEAIATGVCATLETTDYITSTHRGHGHLIAKGGDIKLMMAELFAKKNGYNKGKGGSLHIADMDIGVLGANGIVGAGIPIATGAAFANKYHNNKKVAVSFFGDGASNRGTFHEALNMAGAFKLPAVYICENNLFGISVCARHCMAITDIADRAASYGMPGVVVDGNDVFAVYEEANKAVTRARNGEGPTLIECKTWRHRGHYEGDPDNYRQDEEKQEWLEKDPIKRLEKALLEGGTCAQADLEKILKEIDVLLEEAINEAEAAPTPSITELMTDVYAE